MLACRIRTFLETSVNPNYNHHLYHVLLYRHFIDEEELIPAPTIPPFYPLDFFNLIKDMRNSDLSLTSANTSQIYKYLLNRELLMVHDNAENKEVYKPTRVEEHHPNIDWDMVWSRSRSLSYGSAVESFIFKMVNNILPTDDRLARILPNNTKYCKICSGNITGDLQHWLFQCSATIEVGSWLISLINRLSFSHTRPEDILKLSLECNTDFEDAIIWIIVNTLYIIWCLRSQGKSANVKLTRELLSQKLSILRETRHTILHRKAIALLE